MSHKVRLNPFTGEFDFSGESQAGELLIEGSVSNTVSIGDIIHPSSVTPNIYESSTNNTDIERSIGVVVEKPTPTSAKIKVIGLISGYSGLIPGQSVFLSPTGTLTSTVPTSGYVQIMGFATSTSTAYLMPNSIRTKRNP